MMQICMRMQIDMQSFATDAKIMTVRWSSHMTERGNPDEKAANAEGGTRLACPPREGRANAERSGAVECRAAQSGMVNKWL